MVVVVVVAVALGIAAGCGGEDELSAEELGREADRICSDSRAEFAELQQDPPTSPREAAELTRQLVAITEREIGAIRGLDAPQDLEPRLDLYLRARDEGLEILRAGLAAAVAQDVRGYARAQAAIAARALERLRLARAAGLRECSRPFSAPSGK